MDLYQQFIHMSRYSRWIEEKGRRETWDETVDRYMNFIVDWCAENLKPLDPKDIKEIRDAIYNLEVMPSMRAMMSAGKALKQDQMAGFNCSAIAIDDVKAFDEILYILMCGTGLGFSVEEQFVSKLPVIAESMYPSDTVIVVPDSKIGWATSFRELISMLYSGKVPSWDLSRLRPAGAKLKTFGGRSSGPEPLNKLFAYTVTLFKKAVGRRLTSLECHDLVCMIAVIVVVGGVRRSALISLSDLGDFELRDSKTGRWSDFNGQRGLANNSAVYASKPSMSTFIREWQALYESKSGERGMFNRQAANTASPRRESFVALTNPCFTGDTRFLTVDGWRRFDEMEGKSVDILQDKRVYGQIVDGQVEWKYDGDQGIRVVNSPKVFKTQENAEVYAIVTESGRTIRATGDHDFATSRGMVPLSQLIKGDELMLPDTHMIDRLTGPAVVTESEKFSYKKGVLAGLWVSDGTTGSNSVHLDLWYPSDDVNLTEIAMFEQYVADVISFNDLKSTSNVKPLFHKVSEIDGFTKYRLSSPRLLESFTKLGIYKDNLDWLHYQDLSFKDGFISGMVYGDGSVQWSNGSISLRISQSIKERLTNLQLVLQEFGITSSVLFRRPEREMTIRDKTYMAKDCYELIISGRKNAAIFQTLHMVGFKKNQLAEYMGRYGAKSVYVNKRVDKVVSVTFDGREDVYCLQEDRYMTLIANGVVARRCGEINLRSAQTCNLSEVVSRDTDTVQDISRKIRIATILGTIQSSFTNFRYVRSIWKKNCDEERLLGVSITGVMGAYATYYASDEQLAEWKQIAIDTNIDYANYFGINYSTAITTGKPSGTVSQLVGVSSGVTHPDYAEYYIRRVRNDVKDPLSQLLIEAGIPYEVDLFNPSAYVFSFPKKATGKTRHEITAQDQLDVYLRYKTHWAEHNISTTIYVGEDEWMAVGAWVYENFDRIGGLSFLPKEDDGHTYQQAPYEEISKEEYDRLVSEMPSSINWDRLSEIELEDMTVSAREVACVSGVCSIV